MEQQNLNFEPVVLRPRSASNLLLTCEHANGRLPGGIRPTREERLILASHHGIDIGAWDLTREIAARLSSTALGGRYSRLWVDLNRDKGDPELVREEAEGVLLGWNRNLTTRDRKARIQSVYDHYHHEIDGQIQRLLASNLRPVLLSIHSFTSRWNGRARDFDCGVLYDRHGSHARVLAAGLRQENLTVKYNAPYSGKLGMMYSVERHGFAHNLPCLELELNQSRIDTSSKIAKLAPAITRAIRRLPTV